MSVPIRPTDRVVVRLPRWLGDAVAAEPVMRAFDAFFRDAGHPENLALAAPMRLLMLFAERHPGVRWIPTDRAPADRPAGWRDNDAALLLTGSFRSAWLVWRARVPVRAGWARDGRGLLLTHAPRPAREHGGVPLGLGVVGRWPRILPRPFGSSCVELAHMLGVPVHDPRPRLAANDEGLAAMKARFVRFRIKPGQPFVLANVGSRPGSAKALPADVWSRTLALVHQRTSLPIVVVCGPGERDALHDVLEHYEGRGTYPCADPVVDLPELVALCQRSALVLTSDTGPRHVAVASGAPVVTVCGPTDPRHTAEWLERQRVVRVEVPCGPCHLEQCNLDGAARHACMTGVDHETIVAAAEELLALNATASTPT